MVNFEEIPSDSPNPETEQPPKLNLGEVYSHLFPGNSLEDLPRGGAKERLKKFFQTYVNEQGLRETRFIVASEKGDNFGERVDLRNPSQYTITCIAQGLKPVEVKIGRSKVDNDDLSDLVDIQLGESLGGAAEKLVIEGGRGMYLANRIIGEDIHYKRPLMVIGVLDGEGKPSGVIYFGSGNQPRRLVRRRVVEPVRKQVFQPI